MARCKLELSIPRHTEKLVSKEYGADLRKKKRGHKEEIYWCRREERALGLTALSHSLHAMLLYPLCTHFVWQQLKYRLAEHH